MSNFFLSLLKYRFFAFQNSLEELQAKKIMVLKLFHSQDDLHFMNGLVLGQKSTTASYLPDFTNAGLLHVLVASGFNISLVAGLAWWGAKKLDKTTRSIAVLMSIWLYTAFLKFEPPLLRAAWMFSVAFFLKYRGIQTKRVRILLFAVGGILLVQPELLGSLSLWLSVLATLGIITFSQRMFLFWNDSSRGLKEAWLPRIKRVFLEEASTSFAAQSLIFPVLVWSFHSINLVSFLANPVMLPWLGTLTQVSGLELAVSSLDRWWWGRVLLAVFSRVLGSVFEIYFAAVAWWQRFYFLNTTTTDTSGFPIILAWLAVIGIFSLYTRIKNEEKNHFFHAKP